MRRLCAGWRVPGRGERHEFPDQRPFPWPDLQEKTVCYGSALQHLVRQGCTRWRTPSTTAAKRSSRVNLDSGRPRVEASPDRGRTLRSRIRDRVFDGPASPRRGRRAHRTGRPSSRWTSARPRQQPASRSPLSTRWRRAPRTRPVTTDARPWRAARRRCAGSRAWCRSPPRGRRPVRLREQPASSFANSVAGHDDTTQRRQRGRPPVSTCRSPAGRRREISATLARSRWACARSSNAGVISRTAAAWGGR